MSMHTPADWAGHATANMSQAQKAHLGASKQMESSRRAHDDTVLNNISCYDHVHKTMGQKVKNTQRLIEKLNLRQQSIENSLNAQRSSLAVLEQAVADKESPIRLCQWRLDSREKRPLREQVRDPVEMALEEEHNVLVDTQHRLSEAIKRTKAAIHDLDTTLSEVKHDIEHKVHALNVDESCLRSTERSMQSVLERTPPPSSARGTTRPQNALTMAARHQVAHQESSSNEVRRQQNAEHLSRHAAAKEEAAKALREDSQRLVQRCETMAADHLQRTEKRFQERVHENQSMRRRIEREVRETSTQIHNTKQTITDTRYQLRALEEPMELTSMCASSRQTRATKEHIVDPVTTALHQHRNATLNAHKGLMEHQQQEKAHLKELMDRRDRLSEDLQDKSSALQIDLNCLTREAMPMSPSASLRSPGLGRSTKSLRSSSALHSRSGRNMRLPTSPGARTGKTALTGTTMAGTLPGSLTGPLPSSLSGSMTAR